MSFSYGLKVLGILIVFIFLGVFFYFNSFYGFYKVSFGSEPSLLYGDRIVFSKLNYHVQVDRGLVNIDHEPLSRGDLVIYSVPNNLRVGRILGLPKDKVEVISGNFYINDVQVNLKKMKEDEVPVFGKGFLYQENVLGLKKPHLIFKSLNSLKEDWSKNFKAIVLSKDEYYIVADNRGYEYGADSRYDGPIHASALKGKPLLIVFSSDFGFSWARPFLWPFQIRLDRLFQKIQ